jgi:hypothetical protein
MIEIPVRGGLIAVVDDEDDRFARWKWCLNNKGYVTRTHRVGPRSENKFVAMFLHREVMGMPRDDHREVDHIDRNKLNCQRHNLRVVTHAQNAQNRGLVGHGSSTVRGVSWVPRLGRWRTHVKLNDRFHSLGTYATEAEAAAVVQAWRAQHMPYDAAVQ